MNSRSPLLASLAAATVAILSLMAHPTPSLSEEPGPLTFQSPAQRAALVELFTSQGCSSCPPADAWLGKLTESGDLWKRVVPVAFHVDYWNRLGWRDPFATSESTARQYTHVHSSHLRNAYTPCFVVNGQEWRGWFQRESLKLPTDDAGVLAASLTPDGQLTATFPSTQGKIADLHIALTASGLTTAVTAGENRSRTLTNHFTLATHTVATSSTGEWKTTLPASTIQATPERYALSLWVTPHGSEIPLQATGGWLPESFTGHP